MFKLLSKHRLHSVNFPRVLTRDKGTQSFVPGAFPNAPLVGYEADIIGGFPPVSQS